MPADSRRLTLYHKKDWQPYGLIHTLQLHYIPVRYYLLSGVDILDVLRTKHKTVPCRLIHTPLLLQCVCDTIPFILDVRFVDVPGGVTQEEGNMISPPSF